MSSQPETEVQGVEFIERLMFLIAQEGGRLRLTLSLMQSENPSGNDGASPASKAAIVAMPVVKISGEEEGSECSICLMEYDIGEEVKEMPCKHRYHPGCIEKWLGIHGSCPVCRYKMPVDNETEREERMGAPLVIEFVFGRISTGASDQDED